MKIKFTLQRAAGPVDLVATVDSATTVGDLAAHLTAADPARGPLPPSAGEVTLGLAGRSSIALDPRVRVADSDLRSGCTVSLSRIGSSYADPHRAVAATLRVLDGPDTGKEFKLSRGTSIVGRDRGCDVSLTDSLVSRRHARINVGDVVEIIDLGSANGVQIDELTVPRSILRSTDIVQIGDTRLSVRQVQTAGADTALGGPAVGVVRSPRIDPAYGGVSFEAPEPPERQRGQRFPVIVLLAPLLMGVLLYLITRSLVSIVFVALTPLMYIGNALEARLAARSTYKRELGDFWADVDSLVTDANEAAQGEVARRGAEHPSVADCVLAVRGGTPLLWTRRPAERGFGEVRLGLGRLPSRNTIEMPSAKRSTRALFKRLTERLAPFATVGNVPVPAALSETALGVAGARPHALGVARAVVAQLAALHAPTDLVIAAVASSHAAADWDWLKWLPHTSAPTTPLSVRHLAASPAAAAAVVSELEDLLGRRSGPDAAVATHRPAVALLVEADAPAEHSRLVALAEHGPAHGIYVIWLATETALLPAACKTFVEIGREGLTGTAGYVHAGVAVTPLMVETLDAAAAADIAHVLAPLVDIGARADDASDLPRSVSLLAINGTECASSPEAIIERWNENRSIITGPYAPPSPPKHAGSLRAVIGQAAGQLHAFDLRRDGPHALVGGTTGAGKSELLQSWILAMATAHSPQRLTFLLVDYKGGSAFRDCVDLPHTVGLVTDLSPHLVRRALVSLAAELRHRELVLAQHLAKDLVTLERQGVRGAPPSLVIVVDEFAALVEEVPAFVTGMVNVAQRGRSLGLHLILATQRPAGVIKDNLRANTNLRVALRMAEEMDSTDVLGSPDAAFFDPELPGRAVSKTGPGRLVPFQAGYVGGWTSNESPPPEILVEELVFGGGAEWALPETDAAPIDPGPTDIRRLVDTIGSASSLAQLPVPRKPWLPELRATLDLADQDEVRSRRIDTELVFGIRDDPDNQAQPTVAFHPDRDGNLAVFGTGGSGKSTLLRTLAIAAGFTVRGGPCHVYGIDFGARGLTMLEDLPHVGSVISGADHERITRLLGWLRALIDERAVRYSRRNAATITDYRRIADAPDEPRILLLVDGVAAFRQAYETTDRLRWFEQFTSIAADGRPVGVHVVVSSDQRGGLTTALASAVQARIVLRMADQDDYGMLGVPTDILTASSPAGRGVRGTAELQVAVLGGTSDVTAQAIAVRGFAESMRRSGVVDAPPIRSLPEQVQFSELPPSLDGQPVLGLGSNTLGPWSFAPSGSFIVTGPPVSGRTTTVHAIATALRRHRPDIELYFFGSARSPLAALDCWTQRWFGMSIADGVSGLSAELSGRPASAGSVAVFVEGISDHVNGPADLPLQDLAKVCLAEEHLFVAEGESSTLGSIFGLLGYAKASRSGIALQPDQPDGSTVFRTNFPRTNRAEFPPGRGLGVSLGRVEVVQVAYPAAGASGYRSG